MQLKKDLSRDPNKSFPKGKRLQFCTLLEEMGTQGLSTPLVAALGVGNPPYLVSRSDCKRTVFINAKNLHLQKVGSKGSAIDKRREEETGKKKFPA